MIDKSTLCVGDRLEHPLDHGRWYYIVSDIFSDRYVIDHYKSDGSQSSFSSTPVYWKVDGYFNNHAIVVSTTADINMSHIGLQS